MKRLKLGKIRVIQDEILGRDQLAKIYGGSYPTGSAGGDCGYRSPSNEIRCGLSFEQADAFYQANGGDVCCDLCSSKGGNSGFC
ncbi:hypothetical protein JYB64_20570 [Algoriphagus aestuarii]|nr:hypothetical protein [Algoriphagus aestuarii]